MAAMLGRMLHRYFGACSSTCAYCERMWRRRKVARAKEKRAWRKEQW